MARPSSHMDPDRKEYYDHIWSTSNRTGSVKYLISSSPLSNILIGIFVMLHTRKLKQNHQGAQTSKYQSYRHTRLSRTGSKALALSTALPVLHLTFTGSQPILPSVPRSVSARRADGVITGPQRMFPVFEFNSLESFLSAAQRGIY